jgi:thiosulfate reductase cytochrome b subunit
MKAATERKIIRWIHIIASIPIIGYIYGPVKEIPNAVIAIKWILFPLIVLSGLWLWKGHLVRKRMKRKTVFPG